MAPDASEVTGLLQQWSAGDASARDRLIPLVYDRLRQLAHRRLSGSGADNSLNTTALVHEAYIRLVGAPRIELPDRAHFLALASEIMLPNAAIRSLIREDKSHQIMSHEKCVL